MEESTIYTLKMILTKISYIENPIKKSIYYYENSIL